jgi:hypothetical protein
VHQWLAGRQFLMLTAAGIFTLSLALRTVDDAACDRFPLGTHFVWHLLNATGLYLCVLGLLPTGRPASPR